MIRDRCLRIELVVVETWDRENKYILHILSSEINAYQKH